MPRLVLAVVALALALAASACGGGGGAAGGTPPKEYAAAVCGALTTWQQDLQKASQTLSTSLSASSTPAQVKSKFIGFMSTAIRATERMRAKVKKAGPPDIDEGEQLQTDLDRALGRTETAFRDARDGARKLSTTNPAAFSRQGSKLGDSLTREGNAIEKRFDNLSDEYGSKELDRAFDEEPACKNV